MTITVPKPTKPFPKIPKVPGWFLIAALAIQFVVLNGSKEEVPVCNLKVHWPHYSTYNFRFNKIDTVKVNITSKCNVPQKFTVITAYIWDSSGQKKLRVASFPNVRALADDSDPNTALYKNLFTECKKGIPAQYSASAKGEVTLANGVILPVQGVTSKINNIDCKIGAK